MNDLVFSIEGIPDILRVSLPLPYAPGQVNAWFIEEDDGWSVVDTGARNGASIAFWQHAIEAPIRGRRIRRVIATHHHTDHVGLAGWLCEQSDALFCISRTGYLAAAALRSDFDGERIALEQDFFRAAGCDEEWIAQLPQEPSYRDQVDALPLGYDCLVAGAEVKVGETKWSLIATEGHAAGQLALFSPTRNLLFSADQVLANAHPMVVASILDPRADALADFARSLQQLKELPNNLTVLPGHGEPFADLHAQIDRQLASRARRLTRLTESCGKPGTALSIAATTLRRSIAAPEMTVVVGETVSHLEFLVRRGVVDRLSQLAAPDSYVAARALTSEEALELLRRC